MAAGRNQYLALNASARRGSFGADDTSDQAPKRHIEFDDMVAKRKVDLMESCVAPIEFTENDFACYTEDDFRAFAFDMRSFF